MKHITCYLDFISPYAYLAFEKLPEALMGHSYRVTYKPILFAALLKHHGQLGPAEIPSKRDWTYRQVLWLAHTQGVELQLPASHGGGGWAAPAGTHPAPEPPACHQQRRGQGPAQSPHRRGAGPGCLWRAHFCGGWQAVLGAGRLAHAARLSLGRFLVRCRLLGGRCKRGARDKALNPMAYAQCLQFCSLPV